MYSRGDYRGVGIRPLRFFAALFAFGFFPWLYPRESASICGLFSLRSLRELLFNRQSAISSFPRGPNSMISPMYSRGDYRGVGIRPLRELLFNRQSALSTYDFGL